jgi:hypothetical protein
MKLFTAAAILFAAALPAKAGDCTNYQKARDHVYAVLGGPIMPELQAKGVQSKERLNMAMAALNVQFRDEIAAGDKFAPLKMVGLRVFLLPFTGDSVDPNTKKNTCDMVAADPDSKIMLPPLACAAMALDGAAKETPEARTQALAMLDIAKARLAGDPNGEGAKTLYDAVAAPLAACAAE